MSLHPVDIDPWDGPLPSRITELIQSGKEHLERFHILNHQAPVPGFYPSDFELVYRVLRTLFDRTLINRSITSSMIEWGAGIPIVSALSNQLGWKVRALECDQRLYQAALDWVASEGLGFEIQQASFVPDSQADMLSHLGPLQGIQIAPPDIESLATADLRADLVYAYPWPGEAEAVESIFRSVANPGDHLVTFHGSLDIRVQLLN